MRTPSCLALPLFLAAFAARADAQRSVAAYDVTFEASWTATTHPAGFPAGAHFSSLVGGTHDAGVSFWSPGAIATPGIEAMAELGATGGLQTEVVAAFATGHASSVVLGPPVFGLPGQAAAAFVVSDLHPLVTLVTMIAPSPDWFVGVHGLALLSGGAWQDVDVPLFAYDAGTDSGTTFTSLDANTVPKAPIAAITSGGLANGTPLGTFRFRRRWSTLVYGSGVNPAGSLGVLSGQPRLGQTLTVGLADPSGTLAAGASTFLYATDAPTPFFPAGLVVPNVGLSGPGAPGELLVGGNVVEALTGASWTGSPVSFPLPIPFQAGLVGQSFYVQGILIGPPRIGLTEALEIKIGS